MSQTLKCLARIKLNRYVDVSPQSQSLHMNIAHHASARVKLHRYCAFFDIAVFAGKHCDLTSISDKGTGPHDLQQLGSCCPSLNTTPSLYPSQSPSASSPTTSDHTTPSSDSSLGFQQSAALQFPFSRHDSSKICLKSALNIAETFDLMPYPNPTFAISDGPLPIGPMSPLITPRTMPTFACCAMQSAYVLLMIKDQTESLYPSTSGDAGPLVDNMLSRLQQGLWSIWGTLVNYGAAFEALGGMRGEFGTPSWTRGY